MILVSYMRPFVASPAYPAGRQATGRLPQDQEKSAKADFS